jgi:hypothetical protein
MDQTLSKWQPTILSLLRFIIGLLLLDLIAGAVSIARSMSTR